MPGVQLEGGQEKVIEAGRPLDEVARELYPDSWQDIIAAKLDGKLVDLRAACDGERISFVQRGSEEGLEVLRHSTSHVMAQAVKCLFGEVKLGIGPSTGDGFYYDFDMPHKLSPEDLPKVEEEMRRIIGEAQPFERCEVSRDEAIKRLRDEGEQYKIELASELEDAKVTFYTNGDFTDMCRGPHLQNTSQCGVFKLLSVAGAYWRGSERRPMLQRIYGTAFWTEEELEEHLKFLEEVKNRDHRLLGKALDIYSVDEEIGPGLILWHPKGAVIRHAIEDFWRKEHIARGYKLVFTPHIASQRVYETSGHMENYKENMFGPMDVEGKPYWVRPMNCPAQMKIFRRKTRSYRDLPIRYAELGTVYRYERSGTLQGMLRVRGFTQDDAHIFCTPEQLVGEVAAILDLVDFMMTSFGYTHEAVLATRPEKSLGTEEEWERATSALREALTSRGTEYEIDEGGGTFYAPKIDIKLVDAIGRGWQGPTIQVDLTLAKRFDLFYVGTDGKEHEVVIIHRTVLGSMERFVGGLLEHYGGALPVWLSPVQVVVITISDANAPYAKKVAQALRERDLRVEMDLRNEKTGFKIREAIVQKIPYVLIIGHREEQAGAVSIREYKQTDTYQCELDDFLERIVGEVHQKR